jgi:tetratricopeptide (TPR) repeat protein
MTNTLPNFDDLWDYDNPADTEKRFRELLAAAEEARDLSYTLQLLTQIARAQGLQGQFEAAHKTLDRVEPHVSEAPVVEIRYLLERGRVFNSSGDSKSAADLFQKAWTLGEATGEDFHRIDAAHILAIVQTDPEDQMAWNNRALQLAEQSTQRRAKNWLGSLYNNIGWTYHDIRDYDQALTVFQDALDFRQDQGKPGPIRIARWCVARTLRSLNRIEEALKIQQELLAELDQVGEKDGFVYEEVAECLLLLEHHDDARQCFALAYEELSKMSWLAESEPERLARLKKLAQGDDGD